MKMKILITALSLCMATQLFAGLSYEVDARIDRILNGEESFTALAAADVTTTDDLVVGDDASVAGDLAVTGDSDLTGYLSAGSYVAGTELGITEGLFDVIGTTQLVFIASGVTNVLDSDITSE